MAGRRDFLKSMAAVSAGVALSPAGLFAKGTPPDELARPEEASFGADSPSASSPAMPADVNDETLLKIRQARYVSSPDKVKAASLGILHYSDIHGDDVAVARLKEAISKYSPYIDAVLNTGDAALYYADGTRQYPNGAAWWRASGLAEKSLFVLGNHDGAEKSDAKGHLEGSADWDFKGKEWVFDTYYSDYVAGLGCVMPDGFDKRGHPCYKSCFWHKDFEAAKIRLIGLDCMHFNDTQRYTAGEQEKWLEEKLAETLVKGSPVHGYSVIVSTHYPLDDFEGDDERWDENAHRFVYNDSPEGGRVVNHRTGDVTSFHSPDQVSYVANKRFSLRERKFSATEQYGYVSGEANPFADIVRKWVDKGGKFVAWLAGHCHKDMLYYPSKYPDLLCVVVDQAGNLRGNNLTDREEDLSTRFCANYYSVDTQNSLFKIVRLGLPLNRFLIPKTVLCYDYKNRKVIYE